MKFDQALIALRTGYKVRRAGWNGKGMWVALVPEGAAQVQQKISGGYDLLPFLGMKTADNRFVPWLISQADVLADDWELVDDAVPATDMTRRNTPTLKGVRDEQ